MSVSGLSALRAAFIACGHVHAFGLPGAKRERVPALLAGASVLIGAMGEFDIECVEAVDAGLRLGVLSDLSLRAGRHDRRARAVEECMTRFGVDVDRAVRAAALARTLYRRIDCGDAAHGAADGAAEECHLAWACMLHEVGQAVSHTGAHKHGAYIVAHADLPGFTEREQRLLAALVLGQKGGLRKIRAALADHGVARMVLAIRLAVACLHARADGESVGPRLAMDDGMRIVAARDWLVRHPTMAAWLEKERAAWMEVGTGCVVEVG